MPKKGYRKKNAAKRTIAQREYDALPRVKKKRAQRSTARRRAIRAGKAKRGDGKDIDHKKKLSEGGSNKPSNTRVRSRSANRADNGGKGGRPKGGGRNIKSLVAKDRSKYRYKKK